MACEEDERLFADACLVRDALQAYLENQFTLATELLSRGVSAQGDGKETGFYLPYGRCCLAINKALLTFSLVEIEQAAILLSIARDSASRQSAGWISQWYRSYDSYSLTQLHAMLVVAECDVLSGVLDISKSVILIHKQEGQDSHTTPPCVVPFYAAESLYTMYEPDTLSLSSGMSVLMHHFNRLASAGVSFLSAYKKLVHLESILCNMEVSQGENANADKLLEEVKCGVSLSLGCSQLYSAVLPRRVLAMMKLAGVFIEPDKEGGMEKVLSVRNVGFMRPIAACASILGYHLGYLTTLGPQVLIDLDISEETLNFLAALLPTQNFVDSYFRGKLNQLQGQLVNAEKTWRDCIDRNECSDMHWVEVTHICSFELMMNCCYLGKWSEAVRYSSVLMQQSTWSRAYFTFLHVLFTMTHDQLSNQQSDPEVLTLLDNLEEKFASVSGIKVIPVDRLAVLRSRQLSVKPSLALPFCLEQMYIRSAFLTHPFSRDLPVLTQLIDRCRSLGTETSIASNIASIMSAECQLISGSEWQVPENILRDLADSIEEQEFEEGDPIPSYYELVLLKSKIRRLIPSQKDCSSTEESYSDLCNTTKRNIKNRNPIIIGCLRHSIKNIEAASSQ